jgi:hypothetical protein
LYSYAWLENLVGCEIVNAETIHPEWQDLKPGDAVRLHPKMPAIPVAIVERNHALVLGGKDDPEHHIPLVSWAFVLEPVSGEATRLLIRWRSQTPKTVYDLVFSKYLLEPIHFTMERRMMLGIRERAEAVVPKRSDARRHVENERSGDQAEVRIGKRPARKVPNGLGGGGPRTSVNDLPSGYGSGPACAHKRLGFIGVVAEAVRGAEVRWRSVFVDHDSCRDCAPVVRQCYVK